MSRITGQVLKSNTTLAITQDVFPNNLSPDMLERVGAVLDQDDDGMIDFKVQV